MTRLAVFVASFAYVGYCPIAPGTAGAAAGLAVYVVLRWAGGGVIELAAIAALFLAGLWSGTIAERHFGTTDPGQVVLDEVVGMLITLALVPAGWAAALVGFLVFRAFDIVKPFPASRLERLHGGLGVMADDAMSGIYANLVVRGAIWLWPGWFR